MPTLIIEQPGSRTGGRIAGRVLIGRLPTNGIVLADSSISRLHAWIDQEPDASGFFVADTGSLTGTRVNGRAIERRQDLHDGDVIRVGQAQIVFSEEDGLPAGVTEIILAGEAPLANVLEAGVLFDCPCGSPAWVKAASIGQEHKCRHCGRTLRVPDQSGVIAQVIDEPAVMPEPGVPVGASATAVAGMMVSEADEHHEVLAQPHEARADHGDADEHGLLEQLGPDEPVDEHGLSEGVHEKDVTRSEELPVEQPGVSEPVVDDNGELESTGHLFKTWRPGEGTGEPVSPLTAEPPAELPPVADEAVAQQTCSVCQTEIMAGEAMTACPSCGLTFHTGCWEENRGCSAYGCPQVGVLRTAEEVKAESQKTVEEPAGEAEPVGAAEEDEARGFPWEFLFLAVSVLGVLMGALAYGVPAVIALLGTLVYLVGFKETRKRRGILVMSLVVCLIGAGVGVWFSHRWYHGWPPVEKLLYKSTWRKMF